MKIFLYSCCRISFVNTAISYRFFALILLLIAHIPCTYSQLISDLDLLSEDRDARTFIEEWIIDPENPGHSSMHCAEETVLREYLLEKSRINEIVPSQFSDVPAAKNNSSKSIVSVSESDSLALVALYNATNGENWKSRYGWLKGPVYTWDRITVKDGFVTKIRLWNNNLRGEIPPEIGNLAKLDSLYLYGNELSGEIPSEIGNLTSLSLLRLGFNQLEGEIPEEIGNLSNLHYLSLHYNQLSGEIPEEIGNLTNLVVLSLSGNELRGEIPPVIWNLLNLSSLSLNGNLLSGGIPSELGNLTNLTSLYLYDNQFSGEIPPDIGNLTNLINLLLYNNDFSGEIPSEIGNLNNITSLDLRDNQFSGEIPAEIGNLTNLTNLLMQDNELSGEIPKEIGNLTSLRMLYLDGNQLNGEIPEEIGNMTSLSVLYLYSNRFSGLPDLSKLSNLTTVSLENNRFTFGDLQNTGISTMRYSPQAELDIPVQNVSGENIILSFTTDGTGNTYQWYNDGIPIVGETSNEITIRNTLSGIFYCEVSNPDYPELVLTTSAVFLNIDSKQGIVASEFDALTALYNSTGGDNWDNNMNWLSEEPVSNWYGITVKTGYIKKIALAENNLTGSIPIEIASLDKLILLDLYDNLIDGTIPPEIGNLTELSNLSLADNNLTGQIPPEIGNLTNLTILNLYHNQLTGEIPEDIGKLTGLEVLSLYNNHLVGHIPQDIGNLTNLTYLYLHNNQLNGEVPPGIWNLTNLLSLFLSYNQFQGQIPVEISTMTNLSWLRVENNKFTGLPDLSGLPELRFAYVQNNNFTFEDLAHSQGGILTWTYSPQNMLIPRKSVFTIGAEENISLNCNDLTVEGLRYPGNEYAIFKNQEQVYGWSDNPEYYINGFSEENAGKYTIQVRNSEFPELILQSDTIDYIYSENSTTVTATGKLEWTRHYGGKGENYLMELDTDSDGNLYSVGFFSDTIVFDSLHIGADQVSSADLDGFIYKSDPDGNYIWSKAIHSDSTVICSEISILSNDNLLIAGSFIGTADLDPSPATVFASSPDGCIFLICLDKDGNFLWDKTIETNSLTGLGVSLAIDNEQHFYINGTFTGTVDFDPSENTNNLSSIGESDCFVAKFDIAGNLIWVKSFGGAEDGGNMDIAVDKRGNVYTIGDFEDSTIDLDPGDDEYLRSAIGHSIFIQKLDTDGDFTWGAAFDAYLAYGIEVDDSNNVYASGVIYEKNVDFDPGPDEYVVCPKYIDGFILKLDSACNFQWANGIGGAGYSEDQTYDVTIDSYGNVFVTGNFGDSADFNPGPEINMASSNGGGDVYMVSYDSEGRFNWVNAFGSEKSDQGWTIHFDGNNNIYCGGIYNNESEFFIRKYSICSPDYTVLQLFGCDSVCTSEQTYYESGTYYLYEINENGCDSIIELEISISESNAVELTETICKGESIQVGDQFFSQTGFYTVYLTNAAECDSVVVLDLQVKEVDISVTVSGDSIIASAADAAYQWLDCDDGNSPVQGANEQYFVPLTSGNYAVIVQQLSCTDTSDCVSIDVNGLSGLGDINNLFEVFPNPTQGRITVDFGRAFNAVYVEVTNMLGQKESTQFINSKERITIDITGKPGVYFVKIHTGSGEDKVFKVVKY